MPQYEQFFPAWAWKLKKIRDTNCTVQYNAFNNPNKPTRGVEFLLPNCLVSNMEPLSQIEMSIVTILFGLLPSILMMIGPSPADISLLALRRPILALLLAIPMPSVRLPRNGLFQDHALFQQTPIECEIVIRIGFFTKPPIWFKALVSAFEYTLAGIAVANMIVQAYQLAFWAVTVSAIAISNGILPGTYAPFLWIVLIVIMHIIIFIAMNLRYKKDEAHQVHPKSLLRWARNEITPCAYGDPIRLVKKENSYICMFAHYWANMGIVILFLYGTIFLSSTILISLGDAVPVMARFLLASVLCRWVLSFELQGMKEVTSQIHRTH